MYSLKASSAIAVSAATDPREPVASRGRTTELRSSTQNVRVGKTRLSGDVIELSHASRHLAQSEAVNVNTPFNDGNSFFDRSNRKDSSGKDATGIKDVFTGDDDTDAERSVFSSKEGDGLSDADPGKDASRTGKKTQKGGLGATKELSKEEEQQVEELKKRDQEVRAHEQAHKAVGGALAGSIHYVTQTGPDGKAYAVGGSVPIDLSTIPDDLDATIRKMQRAQAAALAPGEPSSADRQIAAEAAATMAQAQVDIAKKRFEKMQGNGESAPANGVLQMTA